MFDFKKQIRDALNESREYVKEQEQASQSDDEAREKMATIDANKMAKSMETEIDYYVKKLKPLTFDSLPDDDEKKASMRQQEVLAFYEKFKRVIAMAIQVAKEQNKELAASDLESDDFRRAVELSTKLIKASDQAKSRNKDKEPQQPEDGGKETEAEEAKPEAPDGSSVDMADALASKYLARTGMGGVAVKTIRGMTDSDGKPYGADTKSRERQVRRHPPGSIYNFKGTDHVIAYYKDNGQAMGFIDTPENEKSLKKMKNLLTSIAADLKKGSMREEKYDKILSLIDEQMNEVWREISESN